MITLKVDKKKRVKVPTQYSDLSFGKLEQLAGLSNSFDIISVLLELTEEEKGKKFDAVSAAVVMRAIKFLEKPLPEIPLNKKLDFKGTQITIDSLEGLPIAAYKDMQRMADIKDGLAVNKWVVAIYLQNTTEDEYNFGKAEALLEEVEKLDCLTVISLSNFFFRRLIALKSGTVKTLNPLRLIRLRLWQGLTSWIDSIFLIYYLAYAKTFSQIEKRF